MKKNDWRLKKKEKTARTHSVGYEKQKYT